MPTKTIFSWYFSEKPFYVKRHKIVFGAFYSNLFLRKCIKRNKYILNWFSIHWIIAKWKTSILHCLFVVFHMTVASQRALRKFCLFAFTSILFLFTKRHFKFIELIFEDFCLNAECTFANNVFFCRFYVFYRRKIIRYKQNMFKINLCKTSLHRLEFWQEKIRCI